MVSALSSPRNQGGGGGSPRAAPAAAELPASSGGRKGSRRLLLPVRPPLHRGGNGSPRGAPCSCGGGFVVHHTRLEPFVWLLAGITMLLVWVQDWTVLPPDRSAATAATPSLLIKPTAAGGPSVERLDGSHPTMWSNASAPDRSGLRTPVQQVRGKTSDRREEAPDAPKKEAPKERDSTDSIDPADKPPEAVAADLIHGAEAAAARSAASAAAETSAREAASPRPPLNDSQPKKEQSGPTSPREEPDRDRPDDAASPASPYEQRWPTYKLPVWASKPYFFRRKVAHQSHNSSQSPVPRVCFVHVGKAAGSSVGCSLGFQLHCSSEYVYPPGHLPVATTNLMHNDVNDCALDMDYYMFTLRHPVERIKSWFLYDWKMLGKIRHGVDDGGCGYGTINELAEVGLAPQPNSLTSKDCHKFAVRVIRGEEKIGNHAYHNYRYYLNQVPSNATLTVIRAEHMLDDWNAMERLLRSGQTVHRLPSKNENKKYRPEDKFVSEAGLRHLCAALCDEIQVYKAILHRATNLSPSQVEESIQELRRTCPAEVDQPACPR